jgi:hypothetical protein
MLELALAFVRLQFLVIPAVAFLAWNSLGVEPHRVSTAKSCQPVSSVVPFADIEHAMHVSNSMAGNITAAYEACRLWEGVFCLDRDASIPPSIAAACYALQASCLVRIGRDDQALPVYDQALYLQQHLEPTAQESVRLGKAHALQRLLRYDEAVQEFRRSPPSKKAFLGAVTCSLRVRDFQGALSLVERYIDKFGSHDVDVSATLGILKYLLSSVDNSLAEKERHVLSGIQHTHPLFHWLVSLGILKRKPGNCLPVRPSMADLASINNGALDDPFLYLLDDKVRLHGILTLVPEVTETFWPETIARDGHQQQRNLNESSADELWICKQRAGYGSHGNIILRAREAQQRMRNLSPDEILQKMVDPPMLLDGHKFSLRIYVAYFMADSSTPTPLQIFLSSQGLVKIAALPYDKGAAKLDLRMHMTNSGRETSMQQEDLIFLQSLLEEDGKVSYDCLWTSIKNAVATTMKLYAKTVRKELSLNESLRIPMETLGTLGLPKILGFDFVVDCGGKAWLVEVNRFPGLQPRDTQDELTKRSVLEDAWRVTMARKSVGTFHFTNSSTGNSGLENISFVE